MLADFRSPEERAALYGEWAKLVDRRSAVVSLLRSTRAQLVAAGQKPLSPEVEEEVPKKSGLEFAWRRKEVAREVLEAFDVDGDGALNDTEWANYRRCVAGDETLREDDVLAADLSLFSEKILEWRRVARDFDGNFASSCAACGATYFSRSEADVLARDHFRKNRACAELRAEHARKHLFEEPRSSRIKDPNRLCKDGFLAWWFSNRPQPEFGFARAAASACFRLGRGLRAIKRHTDLIASEIGKLVERGLLQRARLQAAKLSAATLEASVTVGEGSTPGARLDLKLGPIENSHRFAADLQIPAAARASVNLDVQVRPGTDRATVRRLADKATTVFRRHFEADFKCWPGFLGLRVFPVGDSLRLQLLWKTTLDDWLQRVLGLPDALDFVPEAEASLKLGQSIPDLLLSASHEFWASASLRITYAHDLLGLVLGEVIASRRDATQTRERDSQNRRRAYDAAVSRTRASHGPILAAGEHPEAGVTGYGAPRKDLTDAQARLRDRFDIFFDEHLARFQRILRGTRSARFAFHFKTLEQLLRDNALVRNLLGPPKPLRAATTTKHVAVWWAEVSSKVASEIEALWAQVDNEESREQVRLRKQAQDRADRLAALSAVERKRLDFAEDLAKLQAKMQGEHPAQHEDSDPRVAHAKTLRDGLELYSLACTALTGPTNLTVHSRQLRVTVVMQGLELFDVFP